MIRAFRTVMVLVALTFLTACAADSKFKSYSGPAITQVQVHKKARKLYLLHGKQIVKQYDVDLGNQPIGAKKFEGDGKTPEGLFFIDRQNPNSRYHLSVGISYPRPEDVEFAAAQGRRAGGDIFIHGQGAEGRAAKKSDWTAGCIAVKDEEIEDIYAMLQPGVPIFIFP